MISYKDKTFCASPGCNNVCGRKMSDEEKSRVKGLEKMHGKSVPIAWAYFCGLPAEAFISIKKNEAPE